MLTKLINYIFFSGTVLLVLTQGCIQAQNTYLGLQAWYHPSSLSMAGGGYGILTAESDIKNPALINEKKNSYDLSIIQYPAQVTCGLISFSEAINNIIYSMSLRYLNYGIFDGYDEMGNETGAYSSKDTWITFSAGGRKKNSRISWGVTIGGFFSTMERYHSSIITLTSGLSLKVKKIDANIGLSIVNEGLIISRYTNNKSQLPKRLVGSITKNLKHLPLKITFDIGKENDGLIWACIGGVFTLNYGFQFRCGISSDRLKQRTEHSMASNFLAGTGAGITYSHHNIKFDISGYSLGITGWISGIGLSVLI